MQKRLRDEIIPMRGVIDGVMAILSNTRECCDRTVVERETDGRELTARQADLNFCVVEEADAIS